MHMQITDIRIETNYEADSKVLATAEVVLNSSLSLRGIKILKGRYGTFLAFPGIQPGSPYRAFETLSMRFRKELQEEILEAYRRMQAEPLSLFADAAA